METVGAVLVFFLLLAVIAIAMFVALPAISSENLIPRNNLTGTFSNETITLNDTGDTPASVASLTDVSLTVTTVTNATGGEVIQSGNYSISGGTFTVVEPEYNGSSVNVSSNFRYTDESDAVAVSNNVTSGVADFFASIPTVFVILGAVVIILAVSLILFAVSRFSGVAAGTGSGTARGGGGEIRSL